MPPGSCLTPKRRTRPGATLGPVPLDIADDVPLHGYTTLGLGGPARHFVQTDDENAVVEALRWAAARTLPVFVLGGGSNLVVADAGFPGLVIRVAPRGIAWRDSGERVVLTACAGEPWDDLCATAVARDLAGIECLSGIPGLVGATPIQNVGAYGQEVAETITSVRVLDRATLTVRDVPAAACGFGYRDSAFRRAPDRHVVLAISFALHPGAAPTVRYKELARALSSTPRPTLADVRATVLSLRRQKSMVIDAADDNRQSAGSFFTNPIVTDAEADRIVALALAAGLARDAAEVSRFSGGHGRSKLSAGWLIEHAGIAKGFRRGAVGVSTRHALALVHHGGGTTAELLSLARHVRDTVQRRFGVTLVPEPTLLGVEW